MNELNGQVAIVTGGGQGIGAAISELLSHRGATVAVVDARAEPAESLAARLRSAGADVEAFTLDVRDPSDVERVVTDIGQRLGPIDILVNNAGVTSFVAVLELSTEEWDRIIDVNLKGTFLMCRAVLPSMIGKGRGRVINMSSVLGRNGAANSAHYCASKFGVIGFTESLAAEVGRHDITVNVVSPGVVESPMQDAIRKEMAESGLPQSTSAEVGDWMASLSPLGRTQSAVDVAEMVGFLVSDRASNLTAGVYAVDGGIVAR